MIAATKTAAIIPFFMEKIVAQMFIRVKRSKYVIIILEVYHEA